MGLFSGMFMGIIFGFGLMTGWTKMMSYRANKRTTKAADLKVLTSLGRDELKKLCGDSFPEWISFPEFQQVKWLNSQLTKLWPYVADAAELIIRDSVEPLLEEYRPPGITTMKFTKLTLGTVAPKIEGIRVQSLKEGQVIVDMDLRWGGDPNIVLGIEAAHVASLPIQFKDLQVFTVVRIIVQLADEIPCVSAVVVALLADPKPRIDYTLKAVGGSLTALPGISDLIDDTVDSIVADTLQWPHRIVVPIGEIPIDTSELELKPQGKLTVTVVKANDLKNKELIGKSDPYAVIHIRPLFKVKTKVVDDNLNPVWNETFQLIADDKETQSLIIEVFDEDVGQDKKLGVTKLPLKDLVPEKRKEVELRLTASLDMTRVKDKKDRGTITLKALYHEFDKEEQLAAFEAEKNSIKEKEKMKEEGVIASTTDALDGADSGVGGGLGKSGSSAGAGGAGGGFVGSGIGAMKSELSKAGRFMGRTKQSINTKSKNDPTTPVNSVEENGGVKPLNQCKC